MKLISHCRLCVSAQSCVQWTLDSELDCGLEYGSGTYSFHAVLFHSVKTLYTAVGEGLTPVEILYTKPEVTGWKSEIKH